MRDLGVLVVGLLPASRAKNFLLRRLGHRVAPTAHIRSCLLVRVGSIEVAAGARIGALNIFRDLRVLRLEPGAVIARLNWCTSAPFLAAHGDPAYAGILHLGTQSALTQRHYLDCAGGVTIEEFASVAGVHSVLLTHEIDHVSNRLVCAPIRVERYALISSNAKVVMGAVVPASSLVAMGSVVTRGLERPGRLYAGVPARDKGPVDGEYFQRVQGEVFPSPTSPTEFGVPVRPGA